MELPTPQATYGRAPLDSSLGHSVRLDLSVGGRVVMGLFVTEADLPPPPSAEERAAELADRSESNLGKLALLLFTSCH